MIKTKGLFNNKDRKGYSKIASELILVLSTVRYIVIKWIITGGDTKNLLRSGRPHKLNNVIACKVKKQLFLTRSEIQNTGNKY